VASHDLQEPLRMINIYTQLLLRDLAPRDPKSQKYAEIVNKGVRRMESLLTDLLSFSRTIQASELKVQEADLAKALTQALAT
jgi:signal transduction histidine kinase